MFQKKIGFVNAVQNSFVITNLDFVKKILVLNTTSFYIDCNHCTVIK